MSLTRTSLPTKGDEKIDIYGPFCEGLSGDVDDYGDYSTNDAEEASCQLTPSAINYCMPQPPRPIFDEDSPLVMQDASGPSTVTSKSTFTSGKQPCIHCRHV